MSKTYQVVGACIANLPIDTPQGAQLVMLHQHAVLPPGVPADRIKHLLSVGLIKEVAASAEPKPPAEEPEQKLTARSSKAELVDHGVAQGGDRAELDALTLKELQGRFLKSGQQ
ncbi:hypothetical protein [Streptosporangium sp. NPDC049078]|uniref:hypothetical protein n=1 Tax=Streptosporangium sp. NPDC049078 TaxID=3155767 RepID=UPI0034236346